MSFPADERAFFIRLSISVAVAVGGLSGAALAQAAAPRLMVQNGDQGDGDIAIAPRGELLATSTDGKIQVWSARDGRLLCEVVAVKPRFLVFSPEGRRLAARVEPAPAAGERARLSERRSSRTRGDDEGGGRSTRSRSGRDPSLAVWDLANCGSRRDLEDEVYRSEDMAALGDGRLLVRERKSVHLADPFGGAAPKSLPLPQALPRIEAHAGNGGVVLGRGPDRRLEVIDLAAGKTEMLGDYPGATEQGRGEGRAMVALSNSGRWVVAQSPDSLQLTVYDRQRRKAVASAPTYSGGPPAALRQGSEGVPAPMLAKLLAEAYRAHWIGITPDETRALIVLRESDPASGRLRQVLQVRSLPDLRLQHALPLEAGGRPSPHFGEFALSADGSRLALRNESKPNLLIGVVRLDESAPALALWPTMAGQIADIRFTPAGELVVLNSGQPTADMVRPNAGAPNNALQAGPSSAQDYLMHWPLRTGSASVRPLPQGAGFPAVSGDGRRFAHVEPVAGAPGTGRVMVVDARSFQPLWRGPVLEGIDRVAWLALDQDGGRIAIRRMVSGSLELFDTAAGRALGQIGGLPPNALFTRFSADGQQLLAGDAASIRVVIPLEGPERLRPVTLPFGYWMGSLPGPQPGTPGSLVANAQGAQLSAATAAATTNNERYRETSRRVQEALESANRKAHELYKGMPALSGDARLRESILGRNGPSMPQPAASFDNNKLPVRYVNTRGTMAQADARGEQFAVAGGSPDAPLEVHALASSGKAGEQRFVLEGANESGVSAMTFSPDGKWLAVAGKGGATTLWDLTGRRWLARLYAFGDGTWVVVDPQGRFDTNRLEQVRHLHWVLPDEPLRALPLEIFMRQYYEPRLLPRLMAGEKLPAVRPVDQLNRAQPKVRISQVTPGADGRLSVTVEVSATRDAKGRDGGAHDLRLFRNGQLVARQPATPGALKVDAATGSALMRFDAIRPPSGTAPVEFSAYAFNVDGVKSETAYASWQPPATARAQRGRAFLLAIGINAHENPDWNLQFAANDARRMLQTLTDRARQTGRYEEVIGVPLIAERQGEQLATRAQIQAVLRKLAGQPVETAALAGVPGADKLSAATPDDLVLVSFSGHGHMGTAGRFHLLPSDIGAGRGREVTPALLARTVSSEDLSQWLAELDAGGIAMVIDACYSAAAVQTEGFKPGPMGSRGLGQLAYDKGIRILAASQADDVAIESGRLRHGLLTHALLSDGMDAGHADIEPVDRQIDLAEWLGYGVQRVPELHREVVGGALNAAAPPAGAEPARGATLRIDPQAAPRLAPQRVNAQQPVLFDFTEGRRRPLLALVPSR